MFRLRRTHLILAALAALIVLSLAVPIADARMPRARHYHVHGPITLDTNLRSKSGASAIAIDAYLRSHTSLPRLGAAFLAAERKYGVNARFLLAAAMHESAWGRGAIARIKHNLFGYNAYDRDPFRYATAYGTYAANIRATAKFIRDFYLTPGGRWWGGQPTLRSMQQFWSSSGSWGVNVSRIATSIHLDRFIGKSIKASSPVVDGYVHGSQRATVRLTWHGRAIPRDMKFVATWVRVETPADASSAAGSQPASIGSGVDGMIATGAGPASGRSTNATRNAATEVEPLTVPASRRKSGSRRITLAVRAPDQPGSYELRLEARDSTGRQLPGRERLRIPTTDVRVWDDRAISVALGASKDGTGAVVTITNAGREVIPAVPGKDDPDAGAPVARTARTLALVTATPDDHSGADPSLLLAEPLLSDLKPGASITFNVPGMDALTGRATSWLSVGLSVLGDPTWLGAPTAAGAWVPGSGLEAIGTARAASQAGSPLDGHPASQVPTAGATPPAEAAAEPSPTPTPDASARPSPVPSATPAPKPDPAPKRTKRQYSERSKAINYRGSWGNASHGGYVGGNVRWSKTAGATATFTFTGSSVRWVGPMGSTRGRALVLIDGRAVARVDMGRSTFVARAVLFTHTFRASGHHKLTIKVLATPGRPYVAIDEFLIKP